MRKPMRGLAVLALILSSGACTPMDDAMVAIFGRSMRDQETFDPYESPLLPAEGAVPFSSPNFQPAFGDFHIAGPDPMGYNVPDFGTGIDGTANPDAEVWSTFDNPIAGDASTLERGEVVYNRVCATCHGVDGYGANASIVGPWPALQIYNLAGEQVAGYSDAYIYGMIRVGRGSMPAYGYAITHFDRWAVVNYIRTLQEQAGTTAGGEN